MSDKSQSNSFIGCLGIGSKAPYAYTNSFTVTSINECKKYICIASKDKNGIPSLNIMDSGYTDEPNGMEISFNVHSSDFNTFQTRAIEIYQYFPVLPTITGGISAFNIVKPKTVVQGTGWKLIEKLGRNDRYTSNVVMGYVSYNIDPKYFSDNTQQKSTWGRYSSNTKVDEYAALLQLGLELHMPIGSIEMAISRESLEYTEYTINAIKAQLALVKTELKQLIDKEFDNCTSAWEARCLYTKLTDKLYNLNLVKDVVKLEWKGYDISKQIVIFTDSHISIYSVNNGVKSTRRCSTHHINPSEKMLFYINDIKRGACSIAVRDSKDKHIYIITLNGSDTEKELALIHLCSTLGFTKSKLIYVSTLPPVKNTGMTGPRKTKQYQFKYKPDTQYGRSQSNWWNEVDVDLNNGGCYISLSGLAMQFDNSVMTGTSLYHVLTNAKNIGIKIPIIYGIRPSHINKIKDDPKWENIYDYLRRELINIINNKQSAYSQLENIRVYEQNNENNILEFLGNKSFNVDMNKPFGIFVQLIQRIITAKTTIGSNYSSLSSLMTSLKYAIPNKVSIDFKTEIKNIISHYPILGMLKYYSVNHVDTIKITDYINLVDNS